MNEEPKVVVVARHKEEFHWFKCERDLWVLDINKWRQEFIGHGYDVPEFQSDYRFGIHTVNNENIETFLEGMAQFEVKQQDLSIELAKRFTTASSWWDVADLFPIMFVDFDEHKVAAFYSDGTPMERYIPDGWNGEFIDFANEYPETKFPNEKKFWIRGNSDLLKLLIERGAE